MLKGFLLFLFFFGVMFASTAIAQNPSLNENRDADRAAILADIEAVTQAFIDLNIEKIHSSHSEDWRGFIESSSTPIKGINEYMKANGLPYPPPANLGKPPAALTANMTFKIEDFDLHFIAEDVGIANFILNFVRKSENSFLLLTKRSRK